MKQGSRASLWLALIIALTIPGGPAHALTVHCAPTDPVGGGGSWPMMGRSLQSDRNQIDEHFLDASNAPLLQPAWVFDANRWTHVQNNEITGYPIESDGCIFVGSSTGNIGKQHAPGWIFAMNDDTGDVVWEQQVRGAAYSTLAVSNGVVYAFVSVIGAPYIVAFDEFSGNELWETVVDNQPGSDAVSSPIVYNGMLWVGVSGTSAEGSPTDRPGFEGNSVLLATTQLVAPVFDPVTGDNTGLTKTYQPGDMIQKIWSIPPSDWKKGYAGASQWGTISIDPETGYGYEGTGNPFNYNAESPRSNAILKIDLNLSRSTFGTVVASYKGDIEEQVQQVAGAIPCDQIDQAGGSAAGLSCAHLDLDFGATPNIVRDATGRKLIVEGQKSGVVHFVDADTMQGVTKVRLGVGSAVGGMVGSAATDCDLTVPANCQVFGSHTIGGYLYDIDTTATPHWVTPTLDGAHWGNPVTLANHIIYTVDLKGFLDAYDAGTGAPLLHRPLQLPGVIVNTGTPSVQRTGDLETIPNPPLSWGGTTVARHTVYLSTGVGLSQADLPTSGSMPDGFVMAFRPLVIPVP
ncbi:MAG: outer membrane protein assembly factor BamB family protein [Actinomycetota bacterium]